MSKEKQIQEYESKQLIDELSKMPPMVIATAYLHAINYTLYGEDVTEKWLTATQNASALEKAYRKGQFKAYTEYPNQESVLDKIRAEIEFKTRIVLKDTPNYDWAVVWNKCIEEILDIIDKYNAESEVK